MIKIPMKFKIKIKLQRIVIFEVPRIFIQLFFTVTFKGYLYFFGKLFSKFRIWNIQRLFSQFIFQNHLQILLYYRVQCCSVCRFYQHKLRNLFPYQQIYFSKCKLANQFLVFLDSKSLFRIIDNLFNHSLTFRYCNISVYFIRLIRIN